MTWCTSEHTVLTSRGFSYRVTHFKNRWNKPRCFGAVILEWVSERIKTRWTLKVILSIPNLFQHGSKITILFMHYFHCFAESYQLFFGLHTWIDECVAFLYMIECFFVLPPLAYQVGYHYEGSTAQTVVTNH